MKRFLVLFVLMPLIALLGGCSSDDGTPADGGNGTVDNTPPEIAGIAAIDMFHVQVTFGETVKKASAERSDNYLVIEVAAIPVDDASGAAAAPGDTISVGSAVLGADGRTVTLTTNGPMSNVSYDLEVTGVADLSGNQITTKATQGFTGTNASDTTPPTIVARTPAPGATGVGIGETVAVQFSEPMNPGTVFAAFSWTFATGVVGWEMDEQDANTFVFTAVIPLTNSTSYTVDISGSAQDWSGNALAPASWSYTTTAVVDNTPPTLLSMTPANQSINVPLTSNLVLRFSEPIEQNSLEEVLLTPEIGEGVDVWSNGGATITFDPDLPMMDNTQYTLIILPGVLRDLAGNGNTESYQVVWSTGLGFETGRFSGTISGDPTSTGASNPAGALVIAALFNPFGPGGEGIDFASSAVVENNGSYSVQNLPDGMYFPVSAMDSNGDGEIDPNFGDALGAFGITTQADQTPDSLLVVGGGAVTGIDFQLFDPMVISGYATYSGATVGNFALFFGAFDTTGFDINNLGTPDFATEGFWPFDTEFRIGEFEDGLAAGTYFVGAYLDVNGNLTLDDGVDPANFYSDMGGNPLPITVASGSDGLNTAINLTDPVVAARGSAPVSWRGRGEPPMSNRAVMYRKLAELFRR